MCTVERLHILRVTAKGNVIYYGAKMADFPPHLIPGTMGSVLYSENLKYETDQ